MSPSSPPPPIFRQAALDRLGSPDALDRRAPLTPPRHMIALGALALLCFAILFWSITGTIPVRVRGMGIVVKPGGIYNIGSPVAGTLSVLLVDEGDTVRAGQVVARIQTAPVQIAPDGSKIIPQTVPIIARQSGRILEAFVDPDGIIERGQPLMSLEPGDAKTPLLAVIYVSPLDGRALLPGMEAHIAPSTVRPEEYGFLRGRIVSVSAYPVSQAGMMRAYHNENLVEKLRRGDSPVEVVAELFPNPKNPSGYLWTSPHGPPAPLVSGTLCEASLTLENRRPIELALPIFGGGLLRGDRLKFCFVGVA